MVTLLRHAYALEGPEQAECHHCKVYQGRGVEDTEVGGRGDELECREGLSGIRQAFCDGNQFQIPGSGIDGIRWRFASGGRKPLKWAEELVKAEKDIGKVGRHPTVMGGVI